MTLNCEIILKKGVTADTCRDFRESRRWVMCRTWELLDKKEVESFREGVKKAWGELKYKCLASPPVPPIPLEELPGRRVKVTGELIFE